MCYPDPFIARGESSPCSGGSGFPHTSSDPLPHENRHIIVIKICCGCVVKVVHTDIRHVLTHLTQTMYTRN